MISDFFIRRPVLANVLAILMMVVGVVALLRLPVAQYPDVVPPTVQVTTRFPGASARTVIDAVALPIEQQVNGVEGMIYMQSFSGADGSYSLTVTFKIGVDLDLAQVLVQNRVSSALSSLPQAVQAQGVIVQKNSTAILQIVTLSSPDGRYDSLYLANYATINLKDEVARLHGVGNVVVFGAGQYSMRIWLDPNKMQARGLTTQDVIQSLQQQSEQVTAGQIGAPPTPPGQAFQYTLNVTGKLSDPAEFAEVIVKTGKAGEITRLRDVARVELGAQTYGQVFRLDGKPAAGLAVFQAPGANALDVATEVRKKMTVLAREFPPELTSDIPFDTTNFVQQSIHEVYKTLYEAAILVLIVILVFLQDWRAMLVPATTVPVTIIGAFAAMAALGFTINFSTLFAIVLSIGIVVDDAIVVVEGAVHNIEKGMSGREAASAAMRQLFGPIIGITLVLMSVFLPAAFLPGLTGRMYAQFALVIAATALISAINAATLKPTQCAMWLRPAVPPERRNILFRAFNWVYERTEHWYARLIARLVGRSGISAAVALAIIAVTFYGFARVPTGFLPIEDQGYLIAIVQLPDGASLERTQKVLDKVNEISRKTSGVDKVITIAGVSPLDNSATLASAGVAYIVLKDWGERGKGEDLLSLFTGLNASLGVIEEASILVMPPPPIQGVGNDAGFTMQVLLRDGSFDMAKLQSITDAIVENAKSQSAIQLVLASFRANVPQLTLEVDRVKTQTLGVSLDQVFAALGGYLGSSYVDQFNKFGRVFQIYVQADSQFRLRPEDIQHLSVRNKNGDMIPLGTLVKLTPRVGPSLISLYNLRPSATIIGLPATGVLVRRGAEADGGDRPAHAAARHRLRMELDVLSGEDRRSSDVHRVRPGAAAGLSGARRAIRELVCPDLGHSRGAAVVHRAGRGALCARRAGLNNNLYVQIGLVLLMALSAKNAILIVEFARELRSEGKEVMAAAIEGARARFRPIVMTSFAFILGVLPLVLATGAGASARKSIGITVFTGMIASTCLAVLFVPPFFVLVQRLEEWLASRKKPSPASTPAG